MLKVLNRNFFISTSNLDFSWSLSRDGIVVGSGQLSIPVLQPAEKHVLSLDGQPWSLLLKDSQGSETYITIFARLWTSERWSDAGHIVASNQLIISEKHDIVQVMIQHMSTYL
jgi:beta-galactosidase/beta-glucuronidase